MIFVRYGRLEALTERLARASSVMLKRIEDTVVREALNLVGYIKAQKLSDQVLHVRTGRLRRSITARFEGKGTDKFRAFVGTNVKYARIHEYGFEGTVNVKAHVVKEHQRMQSIAFGKLMKEPRMVTIRSHTVQDHATAMKMPARPFMRPALQENAERITMNIRKALTGAAA